MLLWAPAGQWIYSAVQKVGRHRWDVRSIFAYYQEETDSCEVQRERECFSLWSCEILSTWVSWLSQWSDSVLFFPWHQNLPTDASLRTVATEPVWTFFTFPNIIMMVVRRMPGTKNLYEQSLKCFILLPNTSRSILVWGSRVEDELGSRHCWSMVTCPSPTPHLKQSFIIPFLYGETSCSLCPLVSL